MLMCISPHQDDAALSLSHIVNQLTNQLSIQFVLINCFTKTNYAPYINNNQIDIVKRIRLKEDYNYLGMLKYLKRSVININLPDSPLRKKWEKYNSKGDVCYFTYLEDEIVIYSNILNKKLIEIDIESSLILAPLGLLHKDHIITSRAVQQKYLSHNVIFYEEIPYRYMIKKNYKDKILKEIQDRVSYRLHNIDVNHPHDHKHWMKCASKYKSQFSDSEIESMYFDLINSSDSILWGSDEVINRANKKLGLQLHYT